MDSARAQGDGGDESGGFPSEIALARFQRADVALLEARQLLRRVDTKFVLPFGRLPGLLDALREDYALLEAAGAPSDRYETLYFDSPAAFFFTEHLRGRRPRYKVRIRRYLRRGHAFLEVKQKTPAGRTRKWRLEVDTREDALHGELAQFVARYVPATVSARLAPRLWSRFERLQLIGLRTVERITIDWNLSFDPPGSPERRRLGPLVVAEVKQDRQRWRTPAMLALRRGRVRPLSISKYCTGVALLGLGARIHRYRPRLRALRRIAARG